MKAKQTLSNAIKSITNSPTRMIVLGFAAAIFIGAFLLSLPISHNNNEWLSFSDAIFTATSAVCVTGLIIADTATQFNVFGQIVIILLIQIGGLGVMTGTTIITVMIGKKISLKSRMTLQESFGENRLQGLVKLIKNIVIFTLITEAIGALVLMCSMIPKYGARGIWPSIFISISAYCNAGFDVLGALEAPFASLTPFASNVFVLMPVGALIVVGGLGITVIKEIALYRPRKHRMSLHAKIVLLTTALLIVGGWIFYCALEWNKSLGHLSSWGKLVSGLFQSISPRTAGFNSIDQSAMTPASYLMTLLLMFIGASPGSTGGGIKTTTFVCLFIIVTSTLRGRKDVNIGKAKLNSMAIRKVITTITIALMTIFIGSTLVAIAEVGKGIKLSEIVFEVVSAFATVGLSMGITPQLSWFSELVLGFIMFIGRVGPMTLGASILRSNKDKKSKIEYTDAKIIIS